MSLEIWGVGPWHALIFRVSVYGEYSKHSQLGPIPPIPTAHAEGAEMRAYPIFTVAWVGVLLLTIHYVGLEGVEHGPNRDQQFDHLKPRNKAHSDHTRHFSNRRDIYKAVKVVHGNQSL